MIISGAEKTKRYVFAREWTLRHIYETLTIDNPIVDFDPGNVTSR